MSDTDDTAGSAPERAAPNGCPSPPLRAEHVFLVSSLLTTISNPLIDKSPIASWRDIVCCEINSEKCHDTEWCGTNAQVQQSLSFIINGMTTITGLCNMVALVVWTGVLAERLRDTQTAPTRWTWKKLLCITLCVTWATDLAKFFITLLASYTGVKLITILMTPVLYIVGAGGPSMFVVMRCSVLSAGKKEQFWLQVLHILPNSVGVLGHWLAGWIMDTFPPGGLPCMLLGQVFGLFGILTLLLLPENVGPRDQGEHRHASFKAQPIFLLLTAVAFVPLNNSTAGFAVQYMPHRYPESVSSADAVRFEGTISLLTSFDIVLRKILSDRATWDEWNWVLAFTSLILATAGSFVMNWAPSSVVFQAGMALAYFGTCFISFVITLIPKRAETRNTSLFQLYSYYFIYDAIGQVIAGVVLAALFTRELKDEIHHVVYLVAAVFAATAFVFLSLDRRLGSQQQANEEQVSREQMDGEQMDGEQMDGEQMDGEQMDGEQMDGEQSSENSPLLGTAR
ncbi:hypothetical protein GQ53DRAFT_848540 [Thozetella sp. PMI_491]|nr:hypothetical protein GQ53DRAFT_848540 [Thozetella sp. PMI_491]